jgi:hypothetical protein
MEISRRNTIIVRTAAGAIFACLALFVVLGAGHYAAAASLPTGLNNAFSDRADTPLPTIAEQKGAGYSNEADFQTIVGAVVTLVLGLLGVVFLVLAIYAGYSWMTAGGNEETVEKAKKTIVNSIIGIIVVLAAYALSRLIVVTFGSLVFE